METVQKIALVFTIIGAINWLLVGIFDFNLVDYLFSSMYIIARIIYIYCRNLWSYQYWSSF